MRRSIVFAIDVEPDGRKCGPDDLWSGTEVALDLLSSLRVRLEEASQAPVHFNWFLRLDPQIERTWGRRDWVLRACPKLIPTIQRHADLAGVHVHNWRWDDRRGCWFNDFAESWRAHCLERSAEAYKSIFGVHPIASRFGDRSIWNEDIRVLKRHGIRYDLTVEPGTPSHPLSSDPHASSPLPDFRRALRTPYQPAAEDFLRPAPARLEGDFWMVPLTVTRRPHWHPLKCWPFLVRSTLPMNLVLRPRQVWKQLACEMNRKSVEPLVLVLRSGDLAQARFLTNFRFVVERMSTHPGIRNYGFTGVDRAVQAFVQAGQVETAPDPGFLNENPRS